MKLFGTDGIRGKAGVAPLEPATVARVGEALVRSLMDGASPHRFVIGRDTRESGDWIEQELARGLTSGGATVVSAGVVPTPAIAYLARTEGFDAGLVISASHNPYQDNGIKVFGGSGVKLTEALEASVERLVADPSWSVGTAPGAIDRRDLSGPYLAHLEQILDDAGSLAGVPIVVDCANGATAVMAPAFLSSLGFDVRPIGVSPDGRNINLDCGSTHLAGLAKEVVATGAKLGIAFDGDGDRARFVDAAGKIVDGDAVLLIAALQMKKEGRLPGDVVVAR